MSHYAYAEPDDDLHPSYFDPNRFNLHKGKTPVGDKKNTANPAVKESQTQVSTTGNHSRYNFGFPLPQGNEELNAELAKHVMYGGGAGGKIAPKDNKQLHKSPFEEQGTEIKADGVNDVTTFHYQYQYPGREKEDKTLYVRKQELHRFRQLKAADRNVDAQVQHMHDHELFMLDFEERRWAIAKILNDVAVTDTDEESLNRLLKNTPLHQVQTVKSWLLGPTTGMYQKIENEFDQPANKKKFYEIMGSRFNIGNHEAIKKVKEGLENNHWDTDDNLALLSDKDLQEFSFDQLIGLIKKIGVHDSYVSEEDSASIIKLIQAAHSKDRYDHLKEYLFSTGRHSIYKALVKRLDDAHEFRFYELVAQYYPNHFDLAKMRRIKEAMASEAKARKGVEDNKPGVNGADTDRLASMLTPREMQRLETLALENTKPDNINQYGQTRMNLIEHMANDYRVGARDEKTIISLLKNRLRPDYSKTGPAAAKQQSDSRLLENYMKQELLANNWKLLKQLHSVVDGAEFMELRRVIEELFAGDTIFRNTITDLLAGKKEGDLENVLAYTPKSTFRELSPLQRAQLVVILSRSLWTNGTYERVMLEVMEVANEQSDEDPAKDAANKQAMYALLATNIDTIKNSVQGDNKTRLLRLLSGLNSKGSEERIKKANNEDKPQSTMPGIKPEQRLKSEELNNFSTEDFKKLDITKRQQHISKILQAPSLFRN